MLVARVHLPLVAGILLAVPGCNCDSRGSDASSPTAGSSRPERRTAHPLAGSWSGKALVPGQGLVAGVLAIDSEGHGAAVLTARGITLSETFDIVSWDGTTLRVRYQRSLYSLIADLDGSTLQVDLPVIGWVRLDRRPSDPQPSQ